MRVSRHQLLTESLCRHVAGGYAPAHVEELHRQYGDIVRIGELVSAQGREQRRQALKISVLTLC